MVHKNDVITFPPLTDGDEPAYITYRRDENTYNDTPVNGTIGELMYLKAKHIPSIQQVLSNREKQEQKQEQER